MNKVTYFIVVKFIAIIFRYILKSEAYEEHYFDGFYRLLEFSIK